MVGDHVEHFAWLQILEARPAQVGVGTAFRVFAFRKDRLVDGNAERGAAVLHALLQLVEPAHE